MHCRLIQLFVALWVLTAASADDAPFIATRNLEELPQGLHVYPRNPATPADPFSTLGESSKPIKLVQITPDPDSPLPKSRFLSPTDELTFLAPEPFERGLNGGQITWLVHNKTTGQLVAMADLSAQVSLNELFYASSGPARLEVNARLDPVDYSMARAIAAGEFGRIPIPPIDPITEITVVGGAYGETTMANEQNIENNRRATSLTVIPEESRNDVTRSLQLRYTTERETSELGSLNIEFSSTLDLTIGKPVSMILGPHPTETKRALALTFTMTSLSPSGEVSILGFTSESPDELIDTLVTRPPGVVMVHNSETSPPFLVFDIPKPLKSQAADSDSVDPFIFPGADGLSSYKAALSDEVIVHLWGKSLKRFDEKSPHLQGLYDLRPVFETFLNDHTAFAGWDATASTITTNLSFTDAEKLRREIFQRFDGTRSDNHRLSIAYTEGTKIRGLSHEPSPLYSIVSIEDSESSFSYKVSPPRALVTTAAAKVNTDFPEHQSIADSQLDFAQSSLRSIFNFSMRTCLTTDTHRVLSSPAVSNQSGSTTFQIATIPLNEKGTTNSDD